ncbi:MAG: hypothetical protein JWL83_2397 [Actinomycetia bacterium]|nr:hypothetical protein [Actinomycetes bacterium]
MAARIVRSGIAAFVGVVALIGPLGAAAWAPTGHPWKSTTTFSQETFNAETNESVSLGGTMSLKITTSGDQIRGWTYIAHGVLRHTTGTGATSGGRYRATGSSRVTVEVPPGSPSSPTFQTTFTLHPPSPCRAHHPPSPCFNPSTVAVPITTTVDSSGVITAVQVGHSS